MNSPEILEEKLRMLAAPEENGGKTDLFFLGANSFALSARRLKEIFTLVFRYLPRTRRVSMYSRCDDVIRKSDEDLLELKSMGLGDLYIGLESGSNRVLKQCGKGIHAEEMLGTFQRLDRLGIHYSLSSIIGLGGRTWGREHALKTAELYNHTHPRTIRVMTLTPWPSTPLYQEILEGRFDMLSPWEMLQEEYLFLNALNMDVEDCIFVGTHISNNVPLAGLLPQDREMLLEILAEAIAATDPARFQTKTFEHM